VLEVMSGCKCGELVFRR